MKFQVQRVPMGTQICPTKLTHGQSAIYIDDPTGNEDTIRNGPSEEGATAATNPYDVFREDFPNLEDAFQGTPDVEAKSETPVAEALRERVLLIERLTDDDGTLPLELRQLFRERVDELATYLDETVEDDANEQNK